jgi:HD-GYP domain-containing protein (c-di-GMP phosphodiesterase class II)
MAVALCPGRSPARPAATLADIKERPVSEIRVGVDNLRVGMHVCRLDRPWIETPYPLQGIRIECAQDISRLKQFCSYVYVDTERGLTPARPLTSVARPGPAPTNKVLSQEFVALRKQTYTETRRFDEELPQAQRLYDDLNHNVSQVMEDLSRGKSTDIETLKHGVKTMVDSIQRTPSAFLWINRVKTADSYTYRHLLGTSIWCGAFGRHLGLERSDLEDLALGGLLLDVGKSKLPKELLDKSSILSDAEFDLVKTHVEQGVRLLAREGSVPRAVLRIVATHHERWDGSGYPQRLRGIEIPVFGRIAGLVDSFEAMTSPRPFHPGISPHEAISNLYECRGTVFQAELVEQFIQACGVYPTGSLVELSTAEVAVVIGLNGTRRLRPRIMLLLDADKHPYPEYTHVDLALERPDVSVRRGLPLGAFGIDMANLFL